MNSIEEAFAKLEGLLRKSSVRSRKALAEAMVKALDAFTVGNARDFFVHCGYRVPF